MVKESLTYDQCGINVIIAYRDERQSAGSKIEEWKIFCND